MRCFNIKRRIEYFLLGLRDRLGIPFKLEEEINKLNLKEGRKILDFGCGVGSYTFPTAKLVGKRGKVYALEKQPLAIKKIEERAKKEGLYNITTILSDGDTGLPDESIDVILLFGVLPEIDDKDSLLRELYRVLKPNGYLSTRFCHRIKKDEILEIMEGANLFSLREQKGHILNFSKKKSIKSIIGGNKL
jgi:ubiquinone/menaquinone biosynthesis C-methylase UbiE